MFVLVLAACSDGPTSLVDQIPVPVHFTLDWLLALALIAMPFVAGFSDETEPTVFLLGLGVLGLLVTIGTRFRPREAEPKRR